MLYLEKWKLIRKSSGESCNPSQEENVAMCCASAPHIHRILVEVILYLYLHLCLCLCLNLKNCAYANSIFSEKVYLLLNGIQFFSCKTEMLLCIPSDKLTFLSNVINLASELESCIV